MAKASTPDVSRTKLHVLQLWFGWAVVILAVIDIFFKFEGGKFGVAINTLNLPILLLGLLEVVSGRRR